MNRKKRSPIWKLPTDEFQKLIDESISLREVLRFFNLESKGGNYNTFKKRCEEEGFDISKFKGNFGIGQIKPKYTLEEVLVEDGNFSSSHLKKRLFKEKLLEEKCVNCGQGPKWQEQKLTLSLDHKNGNNRDNRIENLRILCPNCHSQTPTFAGKRHKKKYCCIMCGGDKCKTSEKCQKCNSILNRRVERPDKRELNQMLWEKPTLQLSKDFGVSDKAISKWAKEYNLKKPPRGYWAKKNKLRNHE